MLLTTSKGIIASWFRLMAMELGVLALLTGCLSGPGESLGPDGSPEQKRIQGMRVEIEGYIASLGDSSFVVYNTTVLVSEFTEIQAEENGGELTFADLLVGMWVELSGAEVNGAVVAERIEVNTREDNDRMVL